MEWFDLILWMTGAVAWLGVLALVVAAVSGKLVIRQATEEDIAAWMKERDGRD